MNDRSQTVDTQGPPATAGGSISAAKARLLAWAEENDARELKARSSMGAIATRGALAVLVGMVVAKFLTPRHSANAPGSLQTRIGKHLIALALTAIITKLGRRSFIGSLAASLLG